ncbi:hypothetical protein ACVWZD_001002 [Streptomyces sp. TE3672]
MRRTLASAASAIFAASGFLLVAAHEASAATCPTHKTINVPGAEAEYRLACTGDNLRVYGWVDDTRPDQRHAKLYIEAGNGQGRTVINDGWATKKTNFSFTFKGTKSAKAKLSVAY